MDGVIPIPLQDASVSLILHLEVERVYTLMNNTKQS